MEWVSVGERDAGVKTDEDQRLRQASGVTTGWLYCSRPGEAGVKLRCDELNSYVIILVTITVNNDSEFK